MHVFGYGKVTKTKIGEAEPFTLFRGNPKGKKKGHGKCWAIFEISWSGFSEDVYNKLEEMGVDLGREFEPEYLDELRLYKDGHAEKDDSDIWVDALRDGWDLMRVPDEMGSKYFRVMITNHPSVEKKKKEAKKKAKVS